MQNNAGIPGGVWQNSSRREVFKQAIRPLTDAIPFLKRLTPRLWEWAHTQPDLEATMPGTQAGFVVEEVQQVHPAWTPHDAEGQPSLAMRGLDAYVVAAIQEMLMRLEALEARSA